MHNCARAKTKSQETQTQSTGINDGTHRGSQGFPRMDRYSELVLDTTVDGPTLKDRSTVK